MDLSYIIHTNRLGSNNIMGVPVFIFSQPFSYFYIYLRKHLTLLDDDVCDESMPTCWCLQISVYVTVYLHTASLPAVTTPSSITLKHFTYYSIRSHN